MAYFLLGFICALVWVFIGYVIIRELLFKYGRKIVNKTEVELNRLENFTQDRTEIVYPKIVQEAFKGSNSLDELLK
jgi:predicted permease